VCHHVDPIMDLPTWPRLDSPWAASFSTASESGMWPVKVVVGFGLEPPYESKTTDFR
jgi:hypothetical protein